MLNQTYTNLPFSCKGVPVSAVSLEGQKRFITSGIYAHLARGNVNSKCEVDNLLLLLFMAVFILLIGLKNCHRELIQY